MGIKPNANVNFDFTTAERYAGRRLVEIRPQDPKKKGGKMWQHGNGFKIFSSN